MPLANPWKISFLFSSKKSGWSETYYANASNYTIAWGKAYALANVRSRLLGDNADIDFIRVSQEGVRRVSVLVGVGPDTNFPLAREFYVSNADRPGAAVLSRLNDSTDKVSRALFLRGAADNVFDTRTPGNADAVLFSSIFNGDFSSMLTDGTWGIKSRYFPDSPPTKKGIVTWANSAGTLNSRASLDGAIAFVAGDTAIIGKATGLRPSPGAVKVIAWDNDTLTLTLKYSLPFNFIIAPPISIYKYAPVYGAITSLNFERGAIRKTGRPFGVSAGRRPSIPR